MEIKLDKKPETATKLDKKPQTAAKEERTRILELLLKSAAPMGSKYRQRIGYTGGLLTSSMTVAYAQGIQDAIKLILKGEASEKPVQTEEKPNPEATVGTEK